MRELGLGAADVRVRLSDRRLLAVLLEETGIGAARQELALQALEKLGRSEYGPRRKALIADGAADQSIEALESFPQVRALADLEERFPASANAARPLRATVEALVPIGLHRLIYLH